MVAAAGLVEVRRVVEEADGAFGGVLVKERFKRLTVNVGILG